jgi:hypothetical protein
MWLALGNVVERPDDATLEQREKAFHPRGSCPWRSRSDRHGACRRQRFVNLNRAVQHEAIVRHRVTETVSLAKRRDINRAGN